MMSDVVFDRVCMFVTIVGVFLIAVFVGLIYWRIYG